MRYFDNNFFWRKKQQNELLYFSFSQNHLNLACFENKNRACFIKPHALQIPLLTLLIKVSTWLCFLFISIKLASTLWLYILFGWSFSWLGVLSGHPRCILSWLLLNWPIENWLDHELCLIWDRHWSRLGHWFWTKRRRRTKKAIFLWPWDLWL